MLLVPQKVTLCSLALSTAPHALPDSQGSAFCDSCQTLRQWRRAGASPTPILTAQHGISLTDACSYVCTVHSLLVTNIHFIHIEHWFVNGYSPVGQFFSAFGCYE